MIFLYSKKVKRFEKYRVYNKAWPWEENYSQWISSDLIKLISVICFNELVIGFIMAGFDSLLNAKDYRKDFESFPSLFEVAWQILFCMFFEDLGFYWSHRTFHHPKFYKFHKLHHESYNSFSLSAFYSHPIDFILASVLPTILGWKILGKNMHYSTYLIWVVYRTLETMDGHCGYEFPWSPFRVMPFSGSSEYHNFHHSYNEGNYSSLFTYWDTIFKTNEHFYKLRPKELCSKLEKNSENNNPSIQQNEKLIKGHDKKQ